nr:hypothetical protein [Rickettsia amblyommatis]
MIFQATSLFPPTGDNRIAFISGPGSIVTSVQGQADLTLQIDTNFQFKHPSWIKAKATNPVNILKMFKAIMLVQYKPCCGR